jgi:hypothetical protein
VPLVGVLAAADRFVPPALDEGFAAVDVLR